MAKYNFKGVTDNITEPQLDFINKIIQENGFENSDVTFENVGKSGDNYIANVKRIIIEGNNGKMQMIAKIASTNEMMRLMTLSSVLFKNEHVIYTEVLPTFVQLQKEAGVPESEHLRYPKCYGSQTEIPHEVILLEDLKLSQFEMLDRFGSLSSDCVKSVLKNFAVFHSLSFVLRHNEPKTYDSWKAKLVDTFQAMAGNEMLKMSFQGMEDYTLTILDDPEHIRIFKNKVLDTITHSAKLAKADSNSKYTVIQQGDAWTNNLMFRFEDDKVTDSVMIDYQQSKNNSPVADLLYMIFSCTDYETRKRHFYDWIDYYHTEFDKSLSYFNLKANYIYPRDKLDVDLKRYGKLLFGMSIMMANMMIRKSADAEKMMAELSKENNDSTLEQAKELMTFGDDDGRMLYKNKVIGLINSFTEFGLL